MNNPNNYVISQTLVKQFKGDYCAAQVFAIFIAKTHQSIPSLPMQRGTYFETQAIGMGAHGQSLNDLPRLKNGNKNAAHQRIDKQVEIFPDILKKHGIKIFDTQIQLTHALDDIVHLNGTVDFRGSIIDDQLGPIDNALFDLKLTSSIYKEFGDWSWHFPHNMDHTQAFMYTHLWKEVNKEDLPFYYLVFDYAPESSYKIVRKKVEPLDLMELDESIRNTLDKILWHEKNGWETNPSFENCKLCPLKEKCPVYTDAKTIQVV
tara:strand:- start:41678 stop:42463 length:786 start_codon:yes stop_codon:yes gene_type:complete